jgi:hypothetical protein
MEWMDLDNAVREGSALGGYKGYDGADKKLTIVYKGTRYMVKFPKKLTAGKPDDFRASYSNSPFSEYIGCHIFETIGLPVQKTMLGKYNGRVVVACEDFMQNHSPEYQLQEFRQLENSFLDSEDIGRVPKLDVLESILNHHERLNGIRQQAIERYWDVFVVDALIGNFDRHSGNWGYIVNINTGENELAPVYDCGSCLFPEIDDEHIKEAMADEQGMRDRVCVYPTAALLRNGKKINYHDFLVAHEHEESNKALKRIFPKIDMGKILSVVEETSLLSEVRKEFIINILISRYEHILSKAFLSI